MVFHLQLAFPWSELLWCVLDGCPAVNSGLFYSFSSLTGTHSPIHLPVQCFQSYWLPHCNPKVEQTHPHANPAPYFSPNMAMKFSSSVCQSTWFLVLFISSIWFFFPLWWHFHADCVLLEQSSTFLQVLSFSIQMLFGFPDVVSTSSVHLSAASTFFISPSSTL